MTFTAICGRGHAYVENKPNFYKTPKRVHCFSRVLTYQYPHYMNAALPDAGP
ncbi:hypothetical protein BBC0122_021860 [Bartonella choladocola]|uniref:Uncharacterized protein n=1 Tax=Bartonella choladocola TaxID=2750995 RepID=A0A1U9MKC0_9HYPH|nr:hypothetical protein BBC0122_020600 [Bartonella choladocola]AQT48265.1 hypothetical protein BBC0122_021860 [Bartonella choladocola]